MNKAIKFKISYLPVLLFTLATLLSCSPREGQDQTTKEKTIMGIDKKIFGRIDGQDVYLFTLQNNHGMQVKITNFGGIVTSVIFPDKKGRNRDLVLGFDSLQPYLENSPYFGSIVGRYANRIANGRFELDGQTYDLAKNNGNNHLHGGLKGLNKVIWDPYEKNEEGSVSLGLKYLSRDMEEGYPGNLQIKVVYTLTDSNQLIIDYSAETDRATPVNLSHHSYFNLKGADEGDVLDHTLMIDADRYTVVNDQLIPTGELRDVSGTPMDFREGKKVGNDIEKVAGGYDHNYVLNDPGHMRKVAELSESSSGIVMDVYTTEPGLQFYSGNFLDGSIKGKDDKAYRQHYGLCLETQHFPDSPNHPDFPNTILRPGETFTSQTIYAFSTQ